MWTVDGFHACDTLSLQTQNNNLSSSLYVKDSGLLQLLLPVTAPRLLAAKGRLFCLLLGVSVLVRLLSPHPTFLPFYPGLGPAMVS